MENEKRKVRLRERKRERKRKREKRIRRSTDNCKLSFDELRSDETREKRNSQIQRTRRAALSYAHLTIAQCVIVPNQETTMHSSNV